MNESASEYQLKILDLATNRYLDQIAPPSEDNLKYIESNVDEVVWKVATQIYQQSGFKADLMRVKDIVISHIENMRLQLKLQAEQEAAEEAQRAAKLRAEEKRKAAEEAQRAAQLRAEAERRAAEEAQRAAELRAEEERRAAEAAKRVAELREKFDGNQNKVEIFIKIRKMVSEELEIDEEAIALDSDIYRDLDAESMEIFELIMAVEEEFDIEIPDREAEKFELVEDIVNYLHDSLKLQAEQKAAEEAQRAAQLRAEAERKAAEEAKRAVELQAEAERRAAAAAKRVAELREKFDGNPNKEEIFLRLRKVIAEEAKIDEEYIGLDSDIENDLHVDELDVFNLAMAVEEEFDMEIPEEILGSVEKWPPSYSSSNCFRDRVPVGRVGELLDYIYQKIYETTETE